MRIGIDLGGSKISAIAIDERGEELARLRVPTPSSYSAILQQLDELVARLEADLGEQCQVGIGTPGSVSRLSGTMKNCNSTCLNGQLFQQDIEKKLGRPVRIANDANCFALSEAVDGVARDARVVFGVILGTGVGGGLVVDQQCLDGPNGIAGEWGHIPLPVVAGADTGEPRACYCGRINCVETFLSGPGLSLSYRQHCAVTLSARDIARAAAEGESEAMAVLETYYQQLAAALSIVVNIVDPDVLVLGGGVSNIAGIYSAIPQLWQSSVFSDRVDTRLLAAHYGDDSGVRGAAWLWD